MRPGPFTLEFSRGEYGVFATPDGGMKYHQLLADFEQRDDGFWWRKSDEPKGPPMDPAERAKQDPNWTNCLYGGNANGHSKGFCTADACY